MNGWSHKTIGQACRLLTGGTPSRSKPEYFGGDIRWLVSGDIHKEEIFDCDGRITEEGVRSSNAKPLPINSVMIALNGQGKTRGTVALLRIPATCNQSLVCIEPNEKDKLLPEFLYWNLKGRYPEIRRLTSEDDNDRRGLNMPIIRSVKIPLPPLSEQQRIVDILDEAFEGLAIAAANAEKNLKNARELFASELNSIFVEIAGNGPHTPLANVSEVKDGTHDSPKYVEEGIPFVTQKNIRPDGLSLENTRFISVADHNNFYRRSNAAMGDILISMIGANRGMACLVDDPRTFSIKNVGLVKVSPNIDQRYLLYFLKSGCFSVG